MSKLLETQKIDRKEQIFRATRELLARRDFNSLTMEDVAHRADIAKGTVYLYFKNKDTLYSDLIQDLFTEMTATLEDIRKTDAAPDVTLRRILEAQLSFFESHMDVFVHFFRDRATQGPGAQCLQKNFKDLIANLSGVIKKGIQTGHFRDVNPVKAAVAMMGLVRSAIIERIHGFSVTKLSRDADAVWDIFTKGIGK